jgi:hypothetical protein
MDMARPLFILLLTAFLVPCTGHGQITLSGQTAAHFLKSSPSESQRSVNSGRPSFGWESDLFLDGGISDHAGAFVTVRATQDQIINIDYAAIRLTDLTPLHLNIQAGRFDLPFGNLDERRYPRRNFLYSFPLLYEYETSLPDHPTTDQAILAARGKGGGMPLLDGGVYDLGAMVFGVWGPLEYAVAVSSGTVSSTTYGTQNTNGEVGTVARLAVTPFTGLLIGASYAQGAYLEDYGATTPPSLDVNTYRQRSAELDIEFSRGHAVFYGEAVFNRWPVPLPTGDQDFDILGYYAEGKYTLFPRWYVALRISGLRFGEAMLAGQQQGWDYNVTEVEGGIGYFLERNVLLKLVRRETRTYGGTYPKDGLTVLQLAVAY